MPETLQKKGSILLIQGLDTSRPAEYISEQASPDVENFESDRALLKKRDGTSSRGSAIGGTDKEIMHGREFNREGTLYNVRIGRDKIENYDGGTDTWDDITNTDYTGTTDDLFSTAIPLLSGKRILCITNGIDNIRKWTGSGNDADLGGSPPVAKFIQEYQSFLVCANIQGGTDISQRVQWSDDADPETWTGGNSGATDLVEDGQDITGLNVFGQFLCVHKPTSIYLGAIVSTNEVFRFDRKSTEVGTIADASIKNLPTGQQIFLAEDGLRLFNGILAPLIQSPINEEIRDEINLSAAHKAWAVLVIENDEVWVGVPLGSQTVGETVYRYNYKTGAVYKDTRANINAAWRATQSSAKTWDDLSGTWDQNTNRWNDGQLGAESADIHFGDTSGNVTIVDSGVKDDNGTAVTARWSSKDFQNDELGRLNRWQELLLWARGSGSLVAEYSVDEGDTWTAFSGSPFTLDEDFPPFSSPFRGWVDVVDLKFRVRFTVSSSGSSCDIKQFLIGFTPRELI